MHLVVVSAPEGTLAKEKISVEGGRLRYEGNPLSGYDYMVFRIDTPAERDDWDSLSTIPEPYDDAIGMLEKAYGLPDPDAQKTMLAEADRRFGAAKLAAFRAKELTKIVGRNQVIKALQERYAAAKQQLAPGAAEAIVPRKLSQVMAARISVADALSLGEACELYELE